MPRVDGLALGLDREDQLNLAGHFGTVEAFLLHKGDRRPPPEGIEALVQYIETHEAPQVRTGIQLHAELQDTARLLPTGCSSMNDLLRGGYREGHVTELWGPPASGKSQLCMQAAAACAARGETAVYIGTTASCSATRLAVMCQYPDKADSVAQEQVLGMLAHIQILKMHSIHDVLSILDTLSVQLQTQANNPLQGRPRTSMLILDSASAIIAPVLGLGGPSSQGHALMTLLAQQLRAIAHAFMLAVIVTNHTVGGGTAADARPALGESWKVQPHLRVQLSLEGSSELPEDARGLAAFAGPVNPNAPALRRANLHACCFAPCGESAWFELSSTGVVSPAIA